MMVEGKTSPPIHDEVVHGGHHKQAVDLSLVSLSLSISSVGMSHLSTEIWWTDMTTSRLPGEVDRDPARMPLSLGVRECSISFEYPEASRSAKSMSSSLIFSSYPAKNTR